MFNRAFFDTELMKHVDEKRKFARDGAVTVHLKLTTGEMIAVLYIKEVTDSYVVVEIFPRNGKLRQHEKGDRDRGAPIYDLERLAIPFETITEVEITTDRAKDQVGFQVR